MKWVVKNYCRVCTTNECALAHGRLHLWRQRATLGLLGATLTIWALHSWRIAELRLWGWSWGALWSRALMFEMLPFKHWSAVRVFMKWKFSNEAHVHFGFLPKQGNNELMLLFWLTTRPFQPSELSLISGAWRNGRHRFNLLVVFSYAHPIQEPERILE